MIEIIIPANTSWESIFQYYTGKNITISDLVVFIESKGIRSTQKGGFQVGGLYWIRDATGRLVRIALENAGMVAGAVAGGIVGGPVGVAAGAALGAGAEAGAETLVGPGAISAALSIAGAIAFLVYSAWLANQPAEGILAQGGGSNILNDSMDSQIQEIMPVINALKKSLGNDFDVCMETILLNIKTTNATISTRVFSLENVFTAIAVQVVVKSKEKFKTTKIRSKTRKNRK